MRPCVRWPGTATPAFSAWGSSAHPSDWPLLTDALGDDAGLYNVLLLLSGTPHMQAVHRAREIPPEVTRDTVLDLKLNLETRDLPLPVRASGAGARAT